MKYLIRLLIVPVLLMYGCNKDDNNSPDPIDPVLGQISGKVWLTDEFGHQLGVHSNMLITAKTNYFDVSDGGGNYQVNNLAAGYYDLTYEKTGYGTFKKFNIGVIENSTTVLNGVDTLGQKSTTLISNLAVAFQSSDSTYMLSCNVATAPSIANPRSFRLFFGSANNVSYSNYIYTPSVFWTAITVTGVTSSLSYFDFTSNGFTSGQTVYVIAYGESMVTNYYIDPVSFEKHFPNLNTAFPSNTATFILP